jgi:Cu+-exporting ATPase
VLSQIIAHGERRQPYSRSIQKLADQVSAWFMPAVIAIAVVAFIIWRHSPARSGPRFGRGRPVLIVACPALGLATPIPSWSGVGAEREGVLIKDAEL